MWVNVADYHIYPGRRDYSPRTGSNIPIIPGSFMPISDSSEMAFACAAEGILLRPIGAGKRIASEAGYGILIKTRRRAETEADIAGAVRAAAVRKEHKRRTSR